jgi:uncharacterized membrane protein YdbT with pleckstrin-like domain
VKERQEKEASATDDTAAQLERTFADLRSLAETVGAVPAGSATRVATRRQLVATSVVSFVVVAAICWFIWDHWHSVVALVAPLVWIIGHSLRWRRGRKPVLEEMSERVSEAANQRQKPPTDA